MENRDILDALVVELLEKETLLKDEIEVIFKKVKNVSRRPAWTGSATRTPSKQPPVKLSPAKLVIKTDSAVEVEAEAPAKKARKKAAVEPTDD